MLIHSDIIAPFSIRAAVPSTCYLAGHYNRKQEWASIHEQGSRSHNRAFSVRLAGSSPHNMQRLPDKSATWDEWGIFIERLFTLDPDAKIGVYNGRDDFMEKTRAEHERIQQWRPDLAPTHEAPWLV